jgi:hypothetical protein
MADLQHTGAFVIQVRAGANFATGQAAGRVEHVASGRTARFESVDELLQILDRLLEEERR